MGVRPLYYARLKDGIVFASDVEGVLACPGVPQTLDARFIRTTLDDTGLPSRDRTWFEAVRKLPPGHTLTLDDRGLALDRYWSPEDAADVRLADDDAYVEAFLDLYGKAVSDRLRTVHPIGCHLSGGLDSSSITALASRELRRTGRALPHCFKWQVPGAEQTSGAVHDLVQAVAAQEGLAVSYVQPTTASIMENLMRDGARTADTTGTLFPEEPVQREAAGRGIRVILSGWGGDEGIAFHGKGYLPELLLTGQWRRLLDSLGPGRRFRKLLTLVVLPLLGPRAHLFVQRLRGTTRNVRRQSLLDPGFARRVQPLDLPAMRETSVRSVQNFLLGETGHLPVRMEEWAARGARGGIVYRFPLLDRRVLDFACGLPADQYRRGTWGRWLMRNALQRILPQEVCWYREKIDPALAGIVNTAIRDALPLLRDAIAARDPPPTRAQYLDMPVLMQYLDPAAYTADPRVGRTMNALRFLDIA